MKPAMNKPKHSVVTSDHLDPKLTRDVSILYFHSSSFYISSAAPFNVKLSLEIFHPR